MSRKRNIDSSCEREKKKQKTNTKNKISQVTKQPKREITKGENVRELREIAKEMEDNLEYKEREDGSHYYALKDRIKWMNAICHKAHKDRYPSDEIYAVIADTLEIISGLSEGEDETEASDLIAEMQTDSYTSDLTGWLDHHIDHVDYLTDAIYSGAKDGFSALEMAQYLWKQDIANEVLAGIVAKQDEEEDEEEELKH